MAHTERNAGKNIVVYGIYNTRDEIERAVAELRDAGYRSADISALLPDNESTKEFAHVKGTKAPESATVGATTGAAVGGALGWLLGIGALTLPGLGAFVAAGPIMGLLAGAGAGGAAGGLLGALVGLGIPEYEAKRYEGRIKEGGLLLSVHCDDNEWKQKAIDILKRTGANDVSSSGEASADRAESDRPYKMTGNY